MIGNTYSIRISPALKAKAEQLAGHLGITVSDVFRRAAKLISKGRVSEIGAGIFRVFSSRAESVVDFPVCQIYYTNNSEPVRLNGMPEITMAAEDFRKHTAALILNALLTGDRERKEKEGIDYIVEEMEN